MRLYFIDNSLMETCKVIEALKSYYKSKTEYDLDCTMLLVNIKKDERADTIEYYKEVFLEQNTELIECESVETIKNEISGWDTDHARAIIDLHMFANEDICIQQDANYKCVSMECMEVLKKAKVKYVWYSSYLESSFKDMWQKRYKEIYNEDIPTIYEREELFASCFSQQVANEVLGL